MKVRVLNCFKSKRGMLCASMSAVLLVSSLYSQAQDGIAGIQEANTKVRGYFDVGCNLMYAVGAILGLIGAVRVYQKWSNGQPDTGQVAAAWFGSCVFLVVVATVLKSFFGI
ncbi:MAG: DUF4134 domain-containing protein [Sphingobacteriales bacterium]|nr:DUF4134 domain-containing protein [Sphingobacteriales bacterium]OJW01992.1 MAG: carbamoyl phosphate synthetase [Sphingobacteriales bacterium 44-61]